MSHHTRGASSNDASSGSSSSGGALSWLSAPFAVVGDLLAAAVGVAAPAPTPAAAAPAAAATHATAATTNNAVQTQSVRAPHAAALMHARYLESPPLPPTSAHAKHAFPRGRTGHATPGSARQVGDASSSGQQFPGMPVEVNRTAARREQTPNEAPAEEAPLSSPPAAASSEIAAAASADATVQPVMAQAAPKSRHQHQASVDALAAEQQLASITQTPPRDGRPLPHSRSTPFATPPPSDILRAGGNARTGGRFTRESDSLEDEESASQRQPDPRWAALGSLGHAASSPSLFASVQSPGVTTAAALPPAEQLQPSYPATPATPAVAELRPPTHAGQPQLSSLPRLHTATASEVNVKAAAAGQHNRAVSAPDQSLPAGGATATARSLPSVPDLSSYSSANVEEAEAAAAAAAEAAAQAAAAAAESLARQSTPDLLPQLFGFGRKPAVLDAQSSAFSSAQLDPTEPASPVAPARNVKLLNFQRLLSDANVDLAQLRRLSWSGIPPPVRAVCWKLLLGYLPVALARRESTLAKRRAEYATYLADYFFCGLASEEYYAREARGDPLPRAEAENEILKQIKQDVPRTSPGVPFFKLPLVQASLERVLFSFAVRHPASSYVQGMNDLVTPFYAACMLEHFGVDILKTGADADAEAQRAEQAVQEAEQLQLLEGDCYWCLSLLLDSIQDHYTFAQPGVQRMVFKLEELVQRIDGNGNAPHSAAAGSATSTPSKTAARDAQQHVGLAAHLARENVQFLHFGFRWMTVLLMRELRLSLILRLWDSYLSEDGSSGAKGASVVGSSVVPRVGGGVGVGFRQLHVYVCAAFLLRWSRELKRMDFQQLVTFLQKMPTDEWTEADVESLLAQAHIYQMLYSPQHLA